MRNKKIISGRGLTADGFREDPENKGKRPNYIVNTVYKDGSSVAASSSTKDRADVNKRLQQETDYENDTKGKTDIYKKHLGGLFYTRESEIMYNEVLEFFVENGIFLSQDQLYALQEQLNDYDRIAQQNGKLVGGTIKTALSAGKKLIDNHNKAQEYKDMQLLSGQNKSKLGGPIGDAINAHRYNKLQQQTNHNNMLNTMKNQ